MKINIYPIVSSLHEAKRINQDTEGLLNELIKKSEHQISLCDIDELYDSDLALILIQSGGSEQLFLENYSKLKPPFYFINYNKYLILYRYIYVFFILILLLNLNQTKKMLCIITIAFKIKVFKILTLEVLYIKYININR